MKILEAAVIDASRSLVLAEEKSSNFTLITGQYSVGVYNKRHTKSVGPWHAGKREFFKTLSAAKERFDLRSRYITSSTSKAGAQMNIKNMNSSIKKIAGEILDLDTLETRKSDSLDFHDMAVWQIRKALEAAYTAGRESVNTKGK